MSEVIESDTIDHEPPPSDPSAVESDNEFFAKAGPLPVHWDDVRRFPRFYYRSRVQATIYPLKNDPQATPTTCLLLTRDLSRGGINLLHTQQLFPGQLVEFALSDGVIRKVRIAWCRKVANRCYSLGAQFVTKDDAGGVGEPADAAETQE
jgi:hypothetical protein